MIDEKILDKKYGTNKKAFEKLFTAEQGTDLWKKRNRWEKRIMNRIDEGVQRGLRNYQHYYASDLAWDGQVINKQVVPLIEYAQGKIDFRRCKDKISDLSEETKKKFCKYNESGEIVDFDLGKFHEVWVNLVRSLITRRVAARAVPFINRWPLFRYDPISTDFTAKLRADVLSQRIEMMTNQYGYRHDIVQILRDSLLYGHIVEFPAAAWTVQKQARKKQRAEGLTRGEYTEDEFEVEEFIEKEGIPFVRPHPTRVFHDNAYSLASINSDTGCRYIGYWDVYRFGDIAHNPNYFNRNAVEISGSFRSYLDQYHGYFEAFFDPCNMKFPNAPDGGAPPGQNDRLNNVGFYSGEHEDSSIALVNYFEKVIPRDVGLGDYPYPVWVRLLVADKTTIIFGQIMPSIPAIYYGYNENDNREFNPSFAQEIMPWQDQLSNQMTQLLMLQKQSLIKLILLDLDVLDEEMVVEFRKIAKADQLYVAPHVLEYHGEKARKLGQNLQDSIKIVQSDMLQNVEHYFRSIVQIVSIAERILNFSPQEQGQPAPREITAKEVDTINTTTQTMYDFIGLGLEEGSSAKKKLLYESLITKSQDKVRVPVTRQYKKETIERAGFELLNTDYTEEGAASNYRESGEQTVLGTKYALIYDYNFTSREAIRPPDSKSAEVLVQLVTQLTQISGSMERIGEEQFFKLITEIFRLTGIQTEIRFDQDERRQGRMEEVAREDREGGGPQVQQVLQQIQQAMQGLAGQSEENSARVAQIEEILTRAMGSVSGPPGATPQPNGAGAGAVPSRGGMGGGPNPPPVRAAPFMMGEPEE